MTQSLVILGAVCVVAAAAGGGFKALGVEVPMLKSVPRQILVGVVGVGLIVGGFAIDPGDDDTEVAADKTTTTVTIALDPSVLRQLGTAGAGIGVETTITLSRSSGPPGTVFKVSGRGFQPNELVEISFHARVLGELRADDRGDFANFETQVPATPFRNIQQDVIARGQSSIRSASRPFEVT